ncbi:hypothetical protein G7046_g8051 [Stylonectria norvegica]|nr:hypothetical protein G7046_g8051 [Stylonectria norvegica]
MAFTASTTLPCTQAPARRQLIEPPTLPPSNSPHKPINNIANNRGTKRRKLPRDRREWTSERGLKLRTELEKSWPDKHGEVPSPAPDEGIREDAPSDAAEAHESSQDCAAVSNSADSAAPSAELGSSVLFSSVKRRGSILSRSDGLLDSVPGTASSSPPRPLRKRKRYSPTALMHDDHDDDYDLNDDYDSDDDDGENNGGDDHGHEDNDPTIIRRQFADLLTKSTDRKLVHINTLRDPSTSNNPEKRQTLRNSIAAPSAAQSGPSTRIPQATTAAPQSALRKISLALSNFI